MKKIIAGILLSLVLIMTMGTVVLADAPDHPTPFNSACPSHCATWSGGQFIGDFAKLNFNGPGLSWLAHMPSPCGPCCPPQN